jgi:type IV pilus assembly protein PilO
MPKSSNKIPWEALSEPQVLVRVALGVLLVANLVAAAFAFHIFDSSPEQVGRELAAALETQGREQVQLARSRVLAATIERGKADGLKFLSTSMTSRRRTYSTILRELTETAKTAGMEKAGGSINLQPVAGSEDDSGTPTLDMMSISFNLEGTYPQLVKFVNLLDRSPRFLIIETLTATPRAKSDILTVNFKLDTFVRESDDDSRAPQPARSPDSKTAGGAL